MPPRAMNLDAMILGNSIESSVPAITLLAKNSPVFIGCSSNRVRAAKLTPATSPRHARLPPSPRGFKNMFSRSLGLTSAAIFTCNDRLSRWSPLMNCGGRPGTIRTGIKR